MKALAFQMCPKFHFHNSAPLPTKTQQTTPPMNNNTRRRTIISVFTAAGLLAAASSTQATPYACDVTNSAGVVSFRLNENADNVRIISSSGAVTNDLGAGVKGLTVTNLGLAAGVIKVM